MMKRLFPIFLICALIILSILASCSPSTPAETTTPTTQPTATSSPTATEEVITLKYNSPMQVSEPVTQTGYYFLDYIEQKSNGRVTFERFPGGVLGGVPEHVQLVKSGSVDLGTILPGVAPLPLTRFPIWGSGTDADRLDLTYKVMFENPETAALIEQEHIENNFKLMFMSATTLSGILTKFPVTGLSDLSGKKIGLPSKSEPLNQCGATVVTLQGSEMYEGLARGLVDGVSMNIGIITALKLYEQADYLIRIDDLWATPVGYPVAVNLDTWNSLPEDIQAIFIEAGQATMENSIETVAELKAGYLEAITDAGVTIVEISDEDIDWWMSVMYPDTVNTFLTDAEKQDKLEQAEVILAYCDELAKEVSGKSVVHP